MWIYDGSRVVDVAGECTGATVRMTDGAGAGDSHVAPVVRGMGVLIVVPVVIAVVVVVAGSTRRDGDDADIARYESPITADGVATRSGAQWAHTVAIGTSAVVADRGGNSARGRAPRHCVHTLRVADISIAPPDSAEDAVAAAVAVAAAAAAAGEKEIIPSGDGVGGGGAASTAAAAGGDDTVRREGLTKDGVPTRVPIPPIERLGEPAGRRSTNAVAADVAAEGSTAEGERSGEYGYDEERMRLPSVLLIE